MLMLVLGDNLLVTFLGWEGVGACSYLLISFWFTDATRDATAGKKAFVTNRVGDWGFMIAMFLAFHGRLAQLPRHSTRQPGTLAAATATAIALLLFVGAVRQVGPAAAVRVAARRHGRPDARSRPSSTPPRW